MKLTAAAQVLKDGFGGIEPIRQGGGAQHLIEAIVGEHKLRLLAASRGAPGKPERQTRDGTGRN